jgi:hypothetical protein
MNTKSNKISNADNENNSKGFAEDIRSKISAAYAKATSNIEIKDIQTDNDINENDTTDNDVNDEIDDENIFFRNGDTSSVMRTESIESMNSGSFSSINEKNNYYSNTINDNEIPKWLTEADKQATEKKKMMKKRKKKLTDDWRFWMAIIASISFATAFYSIYQQTGGFSDINNLGSLGGDTGNIGDELIL